MREHGIMFYSPSYMLLKNKKFWEPLSPQLSICISSSSQGSFSDKQCGLWARKAGGLSSSQSMLQRAVWLSFLIPPHFFKSPFHFLEKEDIGLDHDTTVNNNGIHWVLLYARHSTIMIFNLWSKPMKEFYFWLHFTEEDTEPPES